MTNASKHKKYACNRVVVFSVWVVVDCRADDERTVLASRDRKGQGEEQNQVALRALSRLLGDPELKVIFFPLLLHIVELRMC